VTGIFCTTFVVCIAPAACQLTTHANECIMYV